MSRHSRRVASNNWHGTDDSTETVMKTALVALDSSKAEKFALGYAEHGNAARAYREAFDTSDMLPTTVKRMAFDVLHTPAVKARVRELQAAAAERTIISVQARMEWLRDIVEADPNELCQHVRVNCRHCQGVGFAWRWRDMASLRGLSTPIWARSLRRSPCRDRRTHPADSGSTPTATRIPIAHDATARE